MSQPLTTALILALALPLGACDRDAKTPKTSAEKSDSHVFDGAAGSSAGDGTKTGARTTPPPK